MVNTHHEEVLKASTSKGAESPTNDADKDENENGSSSGSKDLNFGGDGTTGDDGETGNEPSDHSGDGSV
ncbi:hypothetical protein Tco_0484680 [Tanacetum coccineum]